MYTISDLIRKAKDGHISSTFGKLPAHVYIPNWVHARLKAEVMNQAYMSGVDLVDATITHIHGLRIHVMAALDHTDIVCSITEEPV